MLTVEIHNEAVQNAAQATQHYIDTVGEHPFNCGFAWVTANVKGNTKVGKSFIEQGFEKSYNGGYQIWNPSGNYTQDVGAKMAGADAYVTTVKKYLPEAPLYTGSRLD
jgi:hypothetical protein